MVDPADLTYPTTLTTIYSTTYTNAAAVTVDEVTVIDPWPTSPDPASAPYTKTETQITQRTVSAAGAAPTATSITATAVWLLWTIQPFDMVPYEPPACPGPDGCSYPSIKPHWKCLDMHLETRCYRQCVLKNWMWWCRRSAEAEGDGLGPVGRVCAGTNTTVAEWEPLLEPCDHTDMMPGCSICPGYEGES